MTKRALLSRIFMYLIVFLLLGVLGFPLIMFSESKQGKVVMDEEISLPFIIEKNKKVVLIYFGYLGCQTICTPSLKEIAEIYKEVDKADDVVFYFIDISKESGDLDAFVHYFHQDFRGLHLSHESRQTLMKDLRAYSSDSLRGDGEMSHTGYLYLIGQEQKKFSLRAMYFTRPFDIKSIVKDIKKELK